MTALLIAKQNINSKHLERMFNNEFNEMFHEVEIDNEFCLDKFMEAEIEFNEIYIKLGLNSKQWAQKLTFRVRKIRGSILGRYYPAYRTLIADVRSINSFAHELGHLIDYEWHCKLLTAPNGKKYVERTKLSQQYPFKQIVKACREHYNNTAVNHQLKSYYNEAEEIFARSFEMYTALKFGTQVISETVEMYSKPSRTKIYPTANAEIMAMIESYFDNLFTETEQLAVASKARA